VLLAGRGDRLHPGQRRQPEGRRHNFNTTGAICFTVFSAVNGWGCSNVDGRTVTVNGTPVTCGQMPLPGSSPYSFGFTAGSYPWASFYWW